MAQADGDTLSFAYVAPRRWQPTRADLRVYEGSYPSDEIGVTYLVKLVGDSLTLSPRPASIQTLRPTYADAFDTSGAAVRFTRDRRGRVDALHLSHSRM